MVTSQLLRGHLHFNGLWDFIVVFSDTILKFWFFESFNDLYGLFNWLEHNHVVILSVWIGSYFWRIIVDFLVNFHTRVFGIVLLDLNDGIGVNECPIEFGIS
ncbi:hypothetical protein Sjap_019983 [Stephania japonica]|uniref:Uncharacterized protein n=1 Tax=Stephania japonica TaxID=461633 RepID=A0AAP0F8U1_9MAGN